MFPQNLKLYLILVLGTTFILLIISPEVECKMRVPRQKGNKMSKGRSQTGINVNVDTAAENVVDDSVQTSNVDPELLEAPIEDTGATTAGPGSAQATKGMSRLAGRVVKPREIVYATAVPIVEAEGFTYLTQHLSSNYYLSDEKGNKDDAVRGCQSIKNESQIYDLASLAEETGELGVVTRALAVNGINEVYINVVLRKVDGKEYFVSSSLHGEKMIQASDVNGLKIKRSALTSLAERRVKRESKGVQQKGRALAEPKKEAVAARDATHFITVIETIFPWVENWKKPPTETCDQSQCEPTNCTVTTPPCTAVTQDCKVRSTGACRVLKTEGCSLVCENCNISKPECYVREPKCILTKDRICTVLSPDCSITTPNCTIERPECVSRQPSCNITLNTAPECRTQESCLTEQGMSCKTVELNCTEEEKLSKVKACSYQECESLPICIKPDYCRKEQVICPPVVTYCPPEIVKCPPPTIVCGEPEIKCVDAVYYCPPPQVVCQKPLISCAAPVVNCPNVLTTCSNPDIQCPPPLVTCPPPDVLCIPPENPCPAHQISGRPCVKECTEDCNCVKLVRNGDEYKYERCACDLKLQYICEGAITKRRNEKAIGGKTSKTDNPKGTATPTKTIQTGKSLFGAAQVKKKA